MHRHNVYGSSLSKLQSAGHKKFLISSSSLAPSSPSFRSCPAEAGYIARNVRRSESGRCTARGNPVRCIAKPGRLQRLKMSSSQQGGCDDLAQKLDGELVLVAGGGGRVGRLVVQRLLEQHPGCRVRAAVRDLIRGREALVNVTAIAGDRLEVCFHIFTFSLSSILRTKTCLQPLGIFPTASATKLRRSFEQKDLHGIYS